MKAVTHAEKEGWDGLGLRAVEKPEPGEGEVRIQLKTAGLNHRDLFVLNRHKANDPAVVLGSDGAGVVDAVGSGVARVAEGEEVIVNPSLNWFEKSAAPPEEFEVLGFPTDGTFAEYIILPEAQVSAKPKHLTWEEAGVLSLGALTAYRALFTRGLVSEGDNVLVPGAGSGVATFLLQFANAAGARVIMTSRSEEKRKRAVELGADVAVDSEADWNAELGSEKADVVIESVGAATFQKSLNQVKKGGTIVTFGASAGDVVEINLREFFYGQYNFLGTTMGSRDEYEEMLQFIEKHDIKPVMDEVFSLEEYEAAFKRMDEGKQMGKIALKM
ncbi:zinc-binding dehydrogenase [Salsuginibacillus kocurii]|uniref:zinc-binding dehydrogenase n=1 Tax=Salsuginibacillus kocurii TaxID=427078 RepID=UPI00037DB0E8|nr:zinc-binding dehydrogenase [Salsuginibacillus kocurii]